MSFAQIIYLCSWNFRGAWMLFCRLIIHTNKIYSSYYDFMLKDCRDTGRMQSFKQFSPVLPTLQLNCRVGLIFILWIMGYLCDMLHWNRDWNLTLNLEMKWFLSHVWRSKIVLLIVQLLISASSAIRYNVVEYWTICSCWQREQF